MSVQLVIVLLRALCDKYATTQIQVNNIYKARSFLDKAFSAYANKKELREILENLPQEFFITTQIQDSTQNIKAFMYAVALKVEII